MKFFTWLGRVLEEIPSTPASPGVPSTTRLTMFEVVNACIVLPMIIWAAICLYQLKLVAFEPTVAYFCLAAFATACGTKLYQNSQEPDLVTPVTPRSATPAVPPEVTQ